jgi:DNA-binding NarL/FixJ family response regulator
MEVLVSLAADGQSNAAIGAELSITERTVRVHIRNIMDKLGASNRTQLVLTAQRLGLTPCEKTEVAI